MFHGQYSTDAPFPVPVPSVLNKHLLKTQGHHSLVVGLNVKRDKLKDLTSAYSVFR